MIRMDLADKRRIIYIIIAVNFYAVVELGKDIEKSSVR